MIVGYHGGEFNSLGNYYLVRQKHAHAWVEAYLEPANIPSNNWRPAATTRELTARSRKSRESGTR